MPLNGSAPFAWILVAGEDTGKHMKASVFGAFPVPAACQNRAEVSGIERHQDDEQNAPEQQRGS